MLLSGGSGIFVKIPLKTQKRLKTAQKSQNSANGPPRQFGTPKYLKPTPPSVTALLIPTICLIVEKVSGDAGVYSFVEPFDAQRYVLNSVRSKDFHVKIKERSTVNQLVGDLVSEKGPSWTISCEK